jgi:hypothetical protein
VVDGIRVLGKMGSGFGCSGPFGHAGGHSRMRYGLCFFRSGQGGGCDCMDGCVGGCTACGHDQQGVGVYMRDGGV